MFIRNINNQINTNLIKNRTVSTKKETRPLISDAVSIGISGDPYMGTIKLDILHMNDVHGAIEPLMDPQLSPDSPVGGLSYTKSLIDREKGKNPEGTLLLNAGDIAEGSMVAYLTKGAVVTDAFREFGFDAIALGNHDFAWGQDGLKNLVMGLNSPVLAANITSKDDGEVMDIAKPYTIKDIKGVKVGIIGLDTTDIPRFVDEDCIEGLAFNNPAETVKKHLPQMKKDGADLVVVLSHLGFEEDKKLAQEVKGIDVIVGGHSHTELPGGHKEGDTIIVQAGSQTRFVGDLELDIDPVTKKILNYEARLIPVIDKDLQPDPTVEKIVNHYLEETGKVSSQIMGETMEDLHYSHKEADKLNQILADAMLEKAGEKMDGKVDFALCSSRMLRGNLKKGSVTMKDLFSAFPMTEENMITLKTTGKMIMAEIESRIKDGGRGIVVPAGFKYEYDPSLPNGSRITSITDLEGKPIEADKEYTIVTSSSLSRSKPFLSATERKNHGSAQEVFFEYFGKGSPWNNDADQRVKKWELTSISL